MQAIICESYGGTDVLRVEEVATPTPKDDQIRIKIHATTVTAGDCELRRFDFPWLFWLPLRLYMGVRRPRFILGQEFAGEVDAVGKKVTRFKVGDAVFAPTEMSLGAYAEYICLPETAPIAKMPEGASFAEAAALSTGGLNALYFLKKAGVQSGQHVLINGAGGSIGTFAVQLAKRDGARVTAVDSADKLPMLREIGADDVIDYRKEDFTAQEASYDVIFDVIGKSPYGRSVRALKAGGCYLLANPSLSGMLRGAWTRMTTNKRVMTGVAEYKDEEIALLGRLLGAGEIRTVIDKEYSLAEMADAHRYVESGEKKGNVIIHIETPSQRGDS